MKLKAEIFRLKLRCLALKEILCCPATVRATNAALQATVLSQMAGWEGAASRFEAQARRPAVLPQQSPFAGKGGFHESFSFFEFNFVSSLQCNRSRITCSHARSGFRNFNAHRNPYRT